MQPEYRPGCPVTFECPLYDAPEQNFLAEPALPAMTSMFTSSCVSVSAIGSDVTTVLPNIESTRSRFRILNSAAGNGKNHDPDHYGYVDSPDLPTLSASEPYPRKRRKQQGGQKHKHEFSNEYAGVEPS